ncbi:hypothetical protein [Streptomyces sp. JNUCC 63]
MTPVAQCGHVEPDKSVCTLPGFLCLPVTGRQQPRARLRLIRGIRALGERAAAELKQRRRTLQHVTLSPSRIGDIARAALALNRIWK